MLQDEVAAARPDIDERTSQLVSKGRWQVPGYKVRGIQFCSGFSSIAHANPLTGEIWRPFLALKQAVHRPSSLFALPSRESTQHRY